jgi:hypothetical protein
MSDFRRFVMSLSGLCCLVLIIASTVIAGFLGAAAIGLVTGRSENAVIGFLLGGATGFVFAALPAAMMFTLTEIAANTRRTAQFLEGTAVQPTAPGPPQTPQQPRIRLRS